MSKKYSSDKEMQKLFEGFRSSVDTSTELEESILDTIKGAIGLGGKEEPAAPEAEEPAAPQKPRKVKMYDVRRNKEFKNILRRTMLNMASNFSNLELSVPRFDMYMMERSGNYTYHIDAIVQLRLGKLVVEEKIKQRIGQISGELSAGNLSGYITADKRIKGLAQDLTYKLRGIVYGAAKDTLEAYAESANLTILDTYHKTEEEMFQMEARELWKETVGSKIQTSVGQVTVPPRKIGAARHNVSSDELAEYIKKYLFYQVPYSIESLFLG